MKAMIISDLLVVKKHLLQQMAMGVVMGLFISVTIGNLYVALPIIGVMIPFSTAFVMVSLDERDHWEQFRLALPLSRINVIAGRYASLALITALGLVIGLLTTGLLVVAATAMPAVPQLAGLVEGLSWQPLVLVSALALAIGVAMLSVILPLVARFGMTKAVRFGPFFVMLGVFFAFSVGGNDSSPQLLTNLAAWSQTPEGALALTGIMLVGSVALYALSGALSARLYRDREF